MKFWQGKKVLITGHTGFKGSWLSLWLQSLGADIIGFSLAPDRYRHCLVKKLGSCLIQVHQLII